ncbi:cysteine protease ATG4D-like isoform X3 [Varroa jacobsoni]|nr:cysteine protease ATG4D-like isoform X3 [Varroa jacobsoni]
MKYGWTAITPGTQIEINDLNGADPLYLLGRMYHVKNDQDAHKSFLSDFRTRIWFTYRQDFEPICETGHQSDSGWGCMLRSAQMLLAQAFMLHLFGRNWRWDPKQEGFRSYVQEQNLHRRIIGWFGDGADSREAPFGIHNLIRAARLAGTKKAGDWFGPSSVAYMLKRCMEDAAFNAGSKDIFEKMAIYVTGDCTIYVQDVINICQPSPNVPWKSVILLIPLRLGGESININYLQSIQDILADPRLNCIGIIGGKPKHSLYFMGFQGNKLIFLDPHYLQSAVNTRAVPFDESSYHCSGARKISFAKLDPSAAIGFYCATQRDFEDFVGLVQLKTGEQASPSVRPGLGARDQPGRSTRNLPMFTIREGEPLIANQSNVRESIKDRILRVERNVITNKGTLRRESDDYVVLD